MREVHRPDCLEALFDVMERCPDAAMMGGGTDLLVRLRGTFDRQPLLLLERVRELQGMTFTDGKLSIGAAVSFSRLIEAPVASCNAPLLLQACNTIGGPALRNMATLGGNIVTASPAGDSLVPLYLLDAELELASRQGMRRIPVNRFILGPGTTVLRQGEVLVRVLVPQTPGGAATAFEKAGLRRALAVAVASFAGLVKLSPTGIVEEARFAWGSVGPTVVRSRELETTLIGRDLSRPAILELAAAVRTAVSPIDDLRATACYRRAVAANLLVRFLDRVHG